MGKYLVINRWLGRLIYSFRGKRRVRLQLIYEGANETTLEGLLLGRWINHYILLTPKLIKETDKSIELEGLVEVPADRVVFIQVLGSNK